MITEELVINAPMARVYAAFADLAFWRHALPDVVEAKSLYEDSCQQEFRMTVERPGGAETIRGVRFLHPTRRIELFQPEPPPAFLEMRGIWSFAPYQGGKTKTRATRHFRLAVPGPSEALIGARLSDLLRRNLLLFRNAIEAQS